jgi:hypothetical protein
MFIGFLKKIVEGPFRLATHFFGKECKALNIKRM